MNKILLWIIPFTLWSSAVSAETSRLVPINDWTYSALEKLAACGFVNPAPLSSKPLGRVQVAKTVAEAIYRIQHENIRFSPFEETKGLELLIDGLMEEYQKELVDLGVTIAETPQTDAPKKRFRIGFPERVHLEKTVSGLETGKSRLVENSQGWRLRKGFNLRADATAYAQWDDWMTVVLTPTLRLTKTEKNLLMEEFYAQTQWKNLRLTLGRQSFWWGPGRHGALVLSNNSFPLNSFRISSAESYQFPWKFKELGGWRTDFFLARMGGEQSIKNPKFAGLRQEWTPAEWLNLGASHTVIFGGKGAPGVTGVDLAKFFFQSEAGNIDEPENHVAGWDWKLTLPKMNRWVPFFHGLQIYGEYSFEDVSLDPNVITLNTAASYLHGLYLADLFKIRDLDLRIEYAEIDRGAYEHFFYKTGYRHKHELLGYHTGPDSKNFYIRVTKRVDDLLQGAGQGEAGIEWDLQRDGMSTQPLTETISELSFFFTRPGPWDIDFKTSITILNSKNFDNQTSAADTDLLLTLEAIRKW